MSLDHANNTARLDLEFWIQRASRADRESVARLCQHFEPILHGYVVRHCSARVRRWSDPEDITQRVLVEVMDQLPSLPDGTTESELRSRLYRTAQSRITDAARRFHREVGESAMGDGFFERRASSSATGPVTRNDELAWIATLVDDLPDKFADVVRACALDGLRFVEAAQELGLSEDVVRKRYHAAKLGLERSVARRRRG